MDQLVRQEEAGCRSGRNVIQITPMQYFHVLGEFHQKTQNRLIPAPPSPL
jgi:hypothetical protein